MDEYLEDTLLEPSFISDEEFPDYCLDLYDTIKFGKRKERKKAARKLVTVAVTLARNMTVALSKLHTAEQVNRNLSHAFAGGVPFADLPGAKIEPERGAGLSPWHLHTEGATVAATCVINEHAHGDDAQVNFIPPAGGWVHVDKDVDEKLKAPPAEADGALQG